MKNIKIETVNEFLNRGGTIRKFKKARTLGNHQQSKTADPLKAIKRLKRWSQAA